MDVRKYQPEIDGIRAIAVLSVVFYHLEYKFIPGGFVGVDVFFVISGYLITRLLLKDAQSGNFSFKRFYLRRIRRLGPALLATLALTFLVSAVYLTPGHFQRFSGAMVASVFSVSNFYFWFESGYFDASAELKPLLHTWSLSVEEQFYLVWPALIAVLALRPRWMLPLVVLLLSVLSLLAARWFTAFEPSASFFLMPFRVYEFGIGAGLALWQLLWLPEHQARVNKWLQEALCALGMALIAYSALAYSKATPFPDVNALVPCVGAALLIAFGQARYLGWLLRNPLSVWFGKISYSLYLVHWPIVVLYKHITFEDVVVGKTRIALMVLTLICAVLLYELVEKRFRFAQPPTDDSARKRARYWFAVPLLLMAFSAHAFMASGWSWRFDAAVVKAIGNIEDCLLYTSPSPRDS